MVMRCPSENTAAIEQSSFFDGRWDAHEVGWVISGSAAAVTCVLSLVTILGHARNYNRPLEQRQIIRILLLAPVFAVISFFSYRFFRAYTYYELVQAAYEAFAIAAFLMLMLQYVGDNPREQMEIFAAKEKQRMPFPFGCFRFRPSKAYFLVLLKWSVVQYVIVRPAESIAGVVLQYYELYCETSLSYKYGHVWLLAIDFASISIALYGLIVLYALLKEELKGRRPLAKFLTIKGVVFFTFYQGFIFSLLQNKGVIKATEYWTATNVSNGLNALAVSLEMVIVAAFQMWAFDWREYHLESVEKRQSLKHNHVNKKGKTNLFWSLVHALNFSDFFVELWHSVRFLFDRIRGKDYTRGDARYGLDFVRAFHGFEGEAGDESFGPRRGGGFGDKEVDEKREGQLTRGEREQLSQRQQQQQQPPNGAALKKIGESDVDGEPFELLQQPHARTGSGTASVGDSISRFPPPPSSLKQSFEQQHPPRSASQASLLRMESNNSLYHMRRPTHDPNPLGGGSGIPRSSSREALVRPNQSSSSGFSINQSRAGLGTPLPSSQSLAPTFATAQSGGQASAFGGDGGGHFETPPQTPGDGFGAQQFYGAPSPSAGPYAYSSSTSGTGLQAPANTHARGEGPDADERPRSWEPQAL